MRCTFLGLPSGALTLAHAGHELRAVGLGRPPSRAEHLQLRQLLPRRCPLLLRPPMDRADVRALFAHPDAPVLVCYLWSRLLPPQLIDAVPAGVLNYHPSLLPRHRGPDPYFWTLWSGDSRAGASVIFLDHGVDSGPIVAQSSLELPDLIDSGALADLLDPLGLELLVDVLDQWERHGRPAPRAQPERLATDAPSPDDDLLQLDWSWPAERLAALVRAASPHPGAYTWLPSRASPLIVLAAHPIAVPASGVLQPGDALWLEPGVTIWTGEGGLVLDAVVTEGEPPRDDAAGIAALFPGLADLRSSHPE